MSETSGKPETFYGIHTDEEIGEFHNKHIHTSQKPRKFGFFANLFGGRGRETGLSISYDTKAMDRATRVPKIFQHEEHKLPLPDGKYIGGHKVK